MIDPGFWACPRCGQANKREFRASYSGCQGCFCDQVTGRFDLAQAMMAVMVLVGVYFMCALVGMFIGLIVTLLPAGLFFSGRREASQYDAMLMLGSAAGCAVGLRMAWNNQVNGGFMGKPAHPLPMPATASPLRRRAEFVAHLTIGAIFMFFTFGFQLEKWMKGYDSDAKSAVIAGLVLAGAAAGWLWFRYKRRWKAAMKSLA